MKRAERKEQGEYTDSEEEDAIANSDKESRDGSDDDDSDDEEKFTAEQLAEAEETLRAQGLLDARDEKKSAAKGKKGAAKVASALKVAADEEVGSGSDVESEEDGGSTADDEEEEDSEEDDDDEFADNPFMQKKRAASGEAADVEEQPSAKRRKTDGKNNNKKTVADKNVVEPDSDDDDNKGNTMDSIFSTVDGERSSQVDLIKAAFVEDGTTFEDEFQKEIDDAVQKKEDILTADNKLKGWGSWAGEGIKDRKKELDPKKQKMLTLMKDAANANGGMAAKVQKFGGKDEKFLAKYEVESVPFPFQSKAQYESTLAAGLGSEWNTTATHKYKVAPQVVTKRGAVVKPIQCAKHLSQKERDELLSAWSANKKPSRPKARF